jgi:hypothetical protein
MNLSRGDTRNDGYRFNGYTNGKEHWVSPVVWAKRSYPEMSTEEREKAKAKARRWYKNNTETALASTKKWKEANVERIREKKNEWLQIPVNRLKSILNQAKTRCKKNQTEFAITVEDLLPIPEYCPVYGIKLNYNGNKGQRGFVNDSPSIDRIDPSKGYIKGNVQIISWRANRIKSDATIQELEQLVTFLKGIQNATQ